MECTLGDDDYERWARHFNRTKALIEDIAKRSTSSSDRGSDYPGTNCIDEAMANLVVLSRQMAKFACTDPDVTSGRELIAEMLETLAQRHVRYKTAGLQELSAKLRTRSQSPDWRCLSCRVGCAPKIC